MSADAIVSYALSLEDLSFGSDPRRYAMTLMPHDDQAWAMKYASGESLCGLTCEAILRACEVDGEIRWHGQELAGLDMPYADRQTTCQTVVYQQELFRQRGLWVEPGRGRKPDAGDMVTVLNMTHVLTVVGRVGDRIEVIEGGQVDPRNGGKSTGIYRHTKLMVYRGEKLYLVPTATPTAQGREVYGWGQAGSLPTVKR